MVRLAAVVAGVGWMLGAGPVPVWLPLRRSRKVTLDMARPDVAGDAPVRYLYVAAFTGPSCCTTGQAHLGGLGGHCQAGNRPGQPIAQLQPRDGHGG